MLSGWLPEAGVSQGVLDLEMKPERVAASRLVLAMTRKLPYESMRW